MPHLDSQSEPSSGRSLTPRPSPPPSEHPALVAFRVTAAVAVAGGALYAGAPWQALIGVAVAIALPAQASGIIRRFVGREDTPGDR